MPYTLMMGLVWVLLAVLLGIVVGWLLRSVAAKRQVDRARSGAGDASTQDEITRLRARVAELESLAVDGAGRREPPAAEAWPPLPPSVAAAGEPAASSMPSDDLEAIVGIGPEVAELCRGIGITSWAELSITEVSLLRTMLADAGPGVDGLDPSTWPEQAALLVAGDTAGFRALVERLDGDSADG